MAIYKCKMCGGTLEFEKGATVGVCDHCGTKQTLPRLDDERRANLYDRANHFRRNNDYDKAAGIYEKILNEDATDAEAYWSLVLCRYGIEYVEDPATHRRVPTVNRAQFTSVFDDDNYKSALQYADALQRALYEEEAAAINEIQKGILAISQKEEPFDVFICYKETDANGRRTQDSVLANDLYHQLTQEGFKVFFSRITLEDKLGTAYEPYIFAALNSAKVMVVLGTKPEHFNAVWVRNEWSRYLALVKQSGGKKVLIPAYRDMDPYDLPEEFSHLQAQDMSKLGFMQDLIRGIKKLAPVEAPKTEPQEVAKPMPVNANAAPLLRRAFMFLEDGDWAKADDFCEQVLNLEPENAQAYLGKLMAELHVRRQEDLPDCLQPFDGSNNYQKAIRFGDASLIDTLQGFIDHINERNENERLTGIYNSALDAMNIADTEARAQAAAELFHSIPGFKDADNLYMKCLERAETYRKDLIYKSAKARMTDKTVSSYELAMKSFESIPGWKDADDQIVVCQKNIEEIKVKEEAERVKREHEEELAQRKAKVLKKKVIKVSACLGTVVIVSLTLFFTIVLPHEKEYNHAIELMQEGSLIGAGHIFNKLGIYKDAKEQFNNCFNKEYNRAVSLMEEGALIEAYQIFAQLEEYNNADLQAEECLSSEYARAVKLMKTDSPFAAYQIFIQLNNYRDAEALAEECWNRHLFHDCISGGKFNTVSLRKDGTVAAVGGNSDGQCDVSQWKSIVSVSAGDCHIVGLKNNGTVVAVGYNDYGQCNVTKWKDIISINAGSFHTVGLKQDGTVVAVGYNEYGRCDVSDWKDITAVSAGGFHTLGLKKDGSVVAVGYNGDGQCNVSEWKNIIAISAGLYYSVGLKEDGTVVAVGYNEYDQCNVSEWKDIIAISAGGFHTLGLKRDGTVVAVGNNKYGQCHVAKWKDIVTISAGGVHSIGLKIEGTVVAIGYDNDGQYTKTENWNNIKIP